MWSPAQVDHSALIRARHLRCRLGRRGRPRADTSLLPDRKATCAVVPMVIMRRLQEWNSEARRVVGMWQGPWRLPAPSPAIPHAPETRRPLRPVVRVTTPLSGMIMMLNEGGS
jgi:hypothetical protein